jgi:hypothetical protein
MGRGFITCYIKFLEWWGPPNQNAIRTKEKQAGKKEKSEVDPMK